MMMGTPSIHENESCCSEVDCEPAPMLTDESVLKKRDLEFPTHDVTVVRRIDTIGQSSFYEAKESPNSPKNSSDGNTRNFLMKATVAATREQARRAEAEVRMLRRLPEHRNMLRLLDSGCSAAESSPANKKRDDDVLLEVQRVYCLLFKDCPSRSVRDIMWKHRTKLAKSGGKSGWIDIETALGIFRQMAIAVSILHDGNCQDERSTVHLDIRPEHFAAFKTSRDAHKGCKYIIKLVGAGCAIDDYMPLDTVADRMKAARLIDSTTSPRYRAPEMINLQLADELEDSADIWGLGCCLFGLLFSKDCFGKDSRQNILKGQYEIPAGHPYSQDVLDLLARMLTVEPGRRPTIHEVISCVDALASGKSLPPKRTKPVRVHDLTSANDGTTIGLGRRPSGAGSHPSRSQCDGTLSTWDYESDMSTSVSTEWLEFAPDDMSGSCLRRFSETGSSVGSVLTPSRATDDVDTDETPGVSQDGGISLLDSSSQRSKQSASSDSRMSHWTYGIIDRMSSRSLIFIDGESSGDDDTFDGSKFFKETPLKVPSVRALGGTKVQTVPDSPCSTGVIEDDPFMANTLPPSPTWSNSSTPHPDETRIAARRVNQKRRPSIEKTGTREALKGGEKSKNSSKQRVVRTKIGSPSATSRKTATQYQPLFNATFPPTDAFFPTHSRHNGTHNTRRSLPSPILPPPSPRRVSRSVENASPRVKPRSRSNH